MDNVAGALFMKIVPLIAEAEGASQQDIWDYLYGMEKAARPRF